MTNAATVRVVHGPLVAPVLSRVVGMLAAWGLDGPSTIPAGQFVYTRLEREYSPTATSGFPLAYATPKTKVLYWNSPNNPTGQVFSRAETEEAAAFACERGIAVVSDEAY